MEFSLDSIISIATLLIGGGGGAFFTWRWQRAKAKAEAGQAEAEAEKAKYEAIQSAATATKEIQDSYQQLLADMKADREEQRSYAEEQKQYIAELKEDRKHLRQDRDELRKRQDMLEETVRTLQADVARNGRMVECMRPFLCGRQGCPDRVSVTISADGAVSPRPRSGKKGGEA